MIRRKCFDIVDRYCNFSSRIIGDSSCHQDVLYSLAFNRLVEKYGNDFEFVFNQVNTIDDFHDFLVKEKNYV